MPEVGQNNEQNNFSISINGRSFTGDSVTDLTVEHDEEVRQNLGNLNQVLNEEIQNLKTTLQGLRTNSDFLNANSPPQSEEFQHLSPTIDIHNENGQFKITLNDQVIVDLDLNFLGNEE